MQATVLKLPTCKCVLFTVVLSPTVFKYRYASYVDTQEESSIYKHLRTSDLEPQQPDVGDALRPGYMLQSYVDPISPETSDLTANLQSALEGVLFPNHGPAQLGVEERTRSR